MTRTTSAQPPAPHGEQFAEVYRNHWPRAVRFISARVNATDRHAVEDLAQTTFLNAWRYADRLLACDDSGRGKWLATVARHVVCDYYRKASGRRLGTEVAVAPHAPVWGSTWVPTVPAADAELDASVDALDTSPADLAAALASLPLEIRRIVELRFLHGVPVNVLVGQMGRGRRTIVRHTATALTALRTHLTSHEQQQQRCQEEQS